MFYLKNCQTGTSLVAQLVKNLPLIQETLVNFWVRKIPWRKEWLLTPVFLSGEFHGHRSLAVYSPWGGKEWDTTKRLSLHFTSKTRNPSIKNQEKEESFILYYSCLTILYYDFYFCLTRNTNFVLLISLKSDLFFIFWLYYWGFHIKLQLCDVLLNKNSTSSRLK